MPSLPWISSHVIYMFISSTRGMTTVCLVSCYRSLRWLGSGYTLCPWFQRCVQYLIDSYNFTVSQDNAHRVPRPNSACGATYHYSCGRHLLSECQAGISLWPPRNPLSKCRAHSKHQHAAADSRRVTSMILGNRGCQKSCLTYLGIHISWTVDLSMGLILTMTDDIIGAAPRFCWYLPESISGPVATIVPTQQI